MSKTDGKLLDVERLWQIERIGTPSLAPDGLRAVVSVTRHSMADNKATSSLWLVATDGTQARRLTQAGDKDAQPKWSPRGDRIAFVARREQQGTKDDAPQLYTIAADGGEAERAATVATGVDAFRWCPDGRRIVCVSWVWPKLKGAKAQAKQAKAWKDRKETGYATSEAQYRYWDANLPQDRTARLHLVDLATGKVRDLFEGTGYELTRADPNADAFDISPDGRRVAFVFDPAAEKKPGNCFALAELDIRSGRVQVLLQDAAWDIAAPRYDADGGRIACTASHQGLKHTMPEQLALWRRETRPPRSLRSLPPEGAAADRERPGAGRGSWEVVSAEWDHAVHAPLAWEDDGQALLFTAEQQGRTHLWRFDLPDRRAEVVVEGGGVQSFDKRVGTLVTLADAAIHPARLHAHVAGRAPLRIERFNDALLAPVARGRVEEAWVTGGSALGGGVDGAAGAGDAVQVWLTYPPGFDPKKRYPVLHVIHGGPHTAAGDNWHYRWNTQVFAAAGYVVACVNYHGSSGFGYAFLDSITHRWGALELQDIEAATDWLLAQPWADAGRVFATGGSYGGYMVAWMNGHVPAGRYAAYICHAGCFDWTAMFADDAYTWHAKELGAWYWDDAAKVAAQSPHAYAGSMATPTLVIHGALDYRVPDAQGLAYYNTLKARGVDARLLWFPDENHWVLKPRNSRQWYQEFFGWLERHTPRGGKSRRPKRRKSVASPG